MELIEQRNKILEIGCGSGNFLLSLAESYKDSQFFGIDISDWSISYAQELANRRDLQNIQFSSGNMESLKFDDEFFDMVFAIKSFHHSFNPQKASNEAYRVLCKSGIFVLIEWAEWAQTGVPEHYFSEQELREILQRSGFQIVEFTIIDDEYFVVASK